MSLCSFVSVLARWRVGWWVGWLVGRSVGWLVVVCLVSSEDAHQLFSSEIFPGEASTSSLATNKKMRIRAMIKLKVKTFCALAAWPSRPPVLKEGPASAHHYMSSHACKIMGRQDERKEKKAKHTKKDTNSTASHRNFHHVSMSLWF